MKKIKLFNPSQFVPTSHYSSEAKADFANTFAAFVENGCRSTEFHKKFYNILMNTRGHIAHYNRHGFAAEWFSGPENVRSFLLHWRDYPVYGQPAYTFSDVEKVLQKWVAENFNRLVAKLEAL